MITLEDIDYQLPTALIAQHPVLQRDHSRLMHLDRDTGAVTHHQFFELPTLLRPGDVLVRNRSRVINARVYGQKPTGGVVEVLLLRCVERTHNRWECLCRPGLKPKNTLSFAGVFSGEISQHVRDKMVHEIIFNITYEQLLSELEKQGETPLPPYIAPDRQHPSQLRERYQTTYAREAGSAAAPTAGLHFTPQLDHGLRDRGITIEEVVLHVGLGTFAPIRTNDVRHHQMHREWFSLSEDTAERLNEAKAHGRRIIAVGTTTVRVLESCVEPQAANNQARLVPQTGETAIFIYPPYQFRFVDALITNFHLPKSSLLLLVSAFVSQPNTRHPFTTFLDSPIGRAYTAAIKEQYRFFSFGDAMMVE